MLLALGLRRWLDAGPERERGASPAPLLEAGRRHGTLEWRRPWRWPTLTRRPSAGPERDGRPTSVVAAAARRGQRGAPRETGERRPPGPASARAVASGSSPPPRPRPVVAEYQWFPRVLDGVAHARRSRCRRAAARWWPPPPAHSGRPGPRRGRTGPGGRRAGSAGSARPSAGSRRLP